MTKKKSGPPKRAPDVETRGFRLWKEKPEGYTGDPLLTINYGIGEEMHESRSYAAIVPGYSLLVLVKRKGDQYWWAVKAKRPDGSTIVKTDVRGPLTLAEYEKNLAEFERDFAPLFDIKNPLVTPGKHYNLYMNAKQ